MLWKLNWVLVNNLLFLRSNNNNFSFLRLKLMHLWKLLLRLRLNSKRRFSFIRFVQIWEFFGRRVSFNSLLLHKLRLLFYWMLVNQWLGLLFKESLLNNFRRQLYWLADHSLLRHLLLLIFTVKFQRANKTKAPK